MGNNLFNQSNFLLATRDSGYKNLASSVAELIDNSLEANANKVVVNFNKNDSDYCVTISDDGTGMNAKTLRIALQFGGSTRFNSRVASGRYGMGLPNSSLSQAKRVDVFSWQNLKKIYHTYLDIDEIIESKNYSIPNLIRLEKNKIIYKCESKSGTIVTWSKCDRLKYKREQSILNELHNNIGRIFRKKIYSGKKIIINNIPVVPYDPLFLSKGKNLIGGLQYGDILTYTVNKHQENNRESSSIVKVRFSLLPIKKWYNFSNDIKKTQGITKYAGISILRADREIDYGWFFMGSKRKENYDDWWRCEIQFEPDLDEYFGVTHTKQEIHPSDFINSILSPDIEKIGRELNRHIRDTFTEIKQCNRKTISENIVAKFDYLLEPVINNKNIVFKFSTKNFRRKIIPGMKYKINYCELQSSPLVIPQLKKNCILVHVNKSHLFYKRYLNNFDSNPKGAAKVFKDIFEILFFSIARAELMFQSKSNKFFLEKLRSTWSNYLNNYLQ